MRDDAEKYAQIIYKCADTAPNNTCSYRREKRMNEIKKNKITIHV